MDASRLASQLESDCQLFVLDTTTSTNDEILRRAQAGGHPPTSLLVVVSGTQTSGRGRLGRNWCSPAGGLYLSALLKLEPAGASTAASSETNLSALASLNSLASLSPLVALAVRKTLQQFSTANIGLKWPNDILSPLGKLAGILIETKQASSLFQNPVDESQFVVVGIGINVHRPTNGAFEGAAFEGAAYLSDSALSDSTEQTLQLEDIAAAVINKLTQYYASWQADNCSFRGFAASYTANMTQLDELVCVRNALGDEIANGTVKGIDEQGRLLLCDGSKTTALVAGEVTLRSGKR